jgi:hypothetical protein
LSARFANSFLQLPFIGGDVIVEALLGDELAPFATAARQKTILPSFSITC